MLLLLLALAGAVLAWRGWRRGALLAAGALLVVLALSTPFVSSLLLTGLEPTPEALRAPEGVAPGAIVVLGGDQRRGRDQDDIGPLTLERLRAGAALHRKTGLPLLVTGGVLEPGAPAVASLMAQSLAEDFRVPVRWVEAAALDTRDNAVFSAKMLQAEGISAVYVVSHGWHLARALPAFQRAGLQAVPAPVPAARVHYQRLADYLPQISDLHLSWWAIHERVGLLFYALRG